MFSHQAGFGEQFLAVGDAGLGRGVDGDVGERGRKVVEDGVGDDAFGCGEVLGHLEGDGAEEAARVDGDAVMLRPLDVLWLAGGYVCQQIRIALSRVTGWNESSDEAVFEFAFKSAEQSDSFVVDPFVAGGIDGLPNSGLEQDIAVDWEIGMVLEVSPARRYEVDVDVL